MPSHSLETSGQILSVSDRQLQQSSLLTNWQPMLRMTEREETSHHAQCRQHGLWWEISIHDIRDNAVHWVLTDIFVPSSLGSMVSSMFSISLGWKNLRQAYARLKSQSTSVLFSENKMSTRQLAMKLPDVLTSGRYISSSGTEIAFSTPRDTVVSSLDACR